jgi:hypothetical protein
VFSQPLCPADDLLCARWNLRSGFGRRNMLRHGRERFDVHPDKSVSAAGNVLHDCRRMFVCSADGVQRQLDTGRLVRAESLSAADDLLCSRWNLRSGFGRRNMFRHGRNGLHMRTNQPVSAAGVLLRPGDQRMHAGFAESMHWEVDGRGVRIGFVPWRLLRSGDSHVQPDISRCVLGVVYTQRRVRAQSVPRRLLPVGHGALRATAAEFVPWHMDDRRMPARHVPAGDQRAGHDH